MFDLSQLRTGRLRRVSAKHGDFLVMAGEAMGVGALLAHYGEYCEQETELMCAVVRPGDVVIEVGANLGAHTVPLARRLTPRGRLIAFEPQPMVAMLLEANLALNGIDWVEVRVAGAGRAFGAAAVPLVDYTREHNVGRVSLIGGRSDGGVPIETIDGLGLDGPVDLIKIDVEGMELDVLEGAAGTIRAWRPMLHVENNPIPAEASIAVLQWLRDAGYDLYWDVRGIL